MKLKPRAPSHLNTRLLRYVTIGYIEPRTHFFGNWSLGDQLGEAWRVKGHVNSTLWAFVGN